MAYLFITLAAVCLILGLVYVFRLLQWQGSERGGPHTVSGASPQNALAKTWDELEQEKAQTINALRELERDFELGKISETDKEHLKADYRAHAKEVLKKQDQLLAPFVVQAEKLLANTDS